jgi:hypothetical protein
MNYNTKTVPTHNNKIMIAKETSNNYDLLFIQVEELMVIANNNSITELVAQMKLMVPEFLSMNSNFDQLDN